MYVLRCSPFSAINFSKTSGSCPVRIVISIKAGIDNQNSFLLDSLLVAKMWDPIRDDPRFGEMLDLLDSKVTHTKQYLRDHQIEQ